MQRAVQAENRGRAGSAKTPKARKASTEHVSTPIQTNSTA